MEERLAGGGATKRGGSEASASEDTACGVRAYTDAALAERHPPVIAILAVRSWTLTVLFLSILCIAVGLHAAYGQVYLYPEANRPLPMSSLDVESAGSLVTWLASLALVAAAFQCIQIHRLRKHKTDDYRGRYRVWSWLPLVFLLMGACVATGLHAELAQLLGSLVDSKAASDPVRLSTLGISLMWTLIAVRLAFEVRDSRGALLALAAATACYCFAAVGALLEVHALSHLILVMARSSLATLGHLCVFLTVAVFGRRVYLEAQGLLQPAKTGGKKKALKKRTPSGTAAKQASQPKPDKAETAAEQEPADTEQDVISLEAARRSRAAQQEDAEEQLDESDGGPRKPSKVERRRQRKQRRQERKAA